VEIVRRVRRPGRAANANDPGKGRFPLSGRIVVMCMKLALRLRALECEVVRIGVRKSSEQKVGLSSADAVFGKQTDKDQRFTKSVPS
jgi:hypothetical protein